MFFTGIGVASAQEEVAEEGITNSAWIAISAGIVMAASVVDMSRKEEQKGQAGF